MSGGVEFLKARRVEGHTCGLPLDDEIITLHINQGLLVQLRRRFRKLWLVNANHPLSRSFYRSTTQFRLEEHKQLSKYYNMIHPYSMGRFYMESTMIFVYLMQFIILPVQAALSNPPHMIYILRVLLDSISIADMIMQFVTGYFNTELNTVIMYRKEVVKNYLKTYFIFDLISVLPVYISTPFVRTEIARYLSIIYVARLFRIFTFIRYIRNFFMYMKWSLTVFYFLKLSLFSAIIICWISTGSFIILYMHYAISPSIHTQEGYWIILELTVKSIYVTTRTMLLLRNMEEYIVFTVGVLLQIVNLIVGGIFNILLYVEIMKIYTQNTTTSASFNNTMSELESYMNFKELDYATKTKILRYVNFKYHHNTITSEIIQENASSIIKNDILLCENKHLLLKVEFFQHLPDFVLLELIKKLRSEVYTEGEVIASVGQPAQCMYFIKMGVVAIYSIKGPELCHLVDGQCFGELALIVAEENRSFSALTVHNTEILKLSRRDFLEAMKNFPNYMGLVRETGMGKLLHLKKRYMN